MLTRFLTWSKIPLKDLLSLPPKDIEQLVINYITNLNARSLSYGYINLGMAAIFHMMDMNDVLLNKKKIAKFLGEHKRMTKDRAYTHEEIKMLADTGDYRFRALVLFLAATGCRIGCIPSLLYRHLERRGDLYKVTIYEGTKEEHYVFNTPESSLAIDQYLDYRRRALEVITPNSPLFRNDFDINSIATVRKNSKPVSDQTLRNILHARLIKTGIIEKSEFKIRKRHDVPMSHGFRKFWMNQAVNAKMNPETREMLLNHKIGIAGAYYRPTEQEMFAEFEKAIDALTIDPTKRMARKIQSLEVERSQIQAFALELEKVKKAIGQ